MSENAPSGQTPSHQSSVVAEDNCDDCGRAMPLTGDSLCRVCHEAEERRFQCPICGGPTMVVDGMTDFCSDKCEAESERWPEP